MKAVSRVHITPHMHWDRVTTESRILLVNNMEEILCRLEQDNEYKYYVLDGQTAILEDYFAVKPENKDRVKKQVEAGKLIIGPWYTQTDTTIVSAESIVRNLMYGMRDCLAFGEPMKILRWHVGQNLQWLATHHVLARMFGILIKPSFCGKAVTVAK